MVSHGLCQALSGDAGQEAAFHLPGFRHPSPLLRGSAPAPGAGIRGSPGWPAGPCSSLILSLSRSAAGAVTWPGTGSSGGPPSPDAGPEDAHGAGLRRTAPDLLGRPIHAMSRADLLPTYLSGAQQGRSEVRGGKALRPREKAAGCLGRTRMWSQNPGFQPGICPSPGTQLQASHDISGLPPPHCGQRHQIQ